MDGYFPIYWEERTGNLYLEVPRLDTDFLYTTGLAAGLGSNDIGLDRGQEGQGKIVRFERVGPRVMLVQGNENFRSSSGNAAERRSVEDSFAKSILWGFTVAAEGNGHVLVDASDFFLRDGHGAGNALGTYRVDRTRTAFYLPRTKNFPKNTEIETTVTFANESEARAWIADAQKKLVVDGRPAEHVVEAYVASLTDLDRLYAEIARQNRKIDVVFANAGLAQLAPFSSVDEKFYDLHFDANVKGMFFTVQKALPLMNDGGAIILTGSIADVKGFPSITVYSATKAAVRSFARTWTSELKDRHIRVNAVSPGPIATPGLDGLAATEEQARQFKAGMVANIPLRRLGAPDEVAKAVVFLASDDSSFVNGAEIFVDGGFAQI